MKAIQAAMPDIAKWFDRDTRNDALHDSGFTVIRR
jgi:hypothetical protein